MDCDVLNLEWSSSGRDREVATLICSALRERGFRVVEASIFNYKHYLVKYRPRLLYAADPKGARVNYQAVKFAQRLGIPVVTFTAEGDYTPEKVEKMFWGHIQEEQLIEQLNLQWSSRTRRMILNLDPSLADRIKVSGAVGFDRYKIYQFYRKEDWMEKYGLDYSHMVGYAGWGFDRFHIDSLAAQQERLYGQAQVEQLRQQRIEVNQVLQRLIEQNPDILFLLKEHPGVVEPDKTELVGLRDYANVICIKNQEAVADCIGGCDVWMAFESTTCLEAWLLGKPTMLINPLGGDFIRSKIHKGSPILRTFDEIQHILREYLQSGAMLAFEAKRDARKQIITETIQWADGKNHMRAAHLFEQVLTQATRHNMHVAILDRVEAQLQNWMFQLSWLFPFLPRFRTYAAARKRFRWEELEELTRRYALCLERFHHEHPLMAHETEELDRINS